MNRVLLDTCVFLWWQAGHELLPPQVRLLIGQADDVFVSAASAWEVAIKSSLGKLEVPEPLSIAVLKAGFHELPIESRHAEIAGSLPLNHKDPFDRMLVAQAQVEELVLVTPDPLISRYVVRTFWPAAEPNPVKPVKSDEDDE